MASPPSLMYAAPDVAALTLLLDGKVFEGTGSSDSAWYIDIVVEAGAALIHLPIGDAHPAAAPLRARTGLGFA